MLLLPKCKMRKRISRLSIKNKPASDKMAVFEKNSELYNRYMKKFADQEDDMERLRKQLTDLREKETSKHSAVEEFVLNLNVE